MPLRRLRIVGLAAGLAAAAGLIAHAPGQPAPAPGGPPAAATPTSSPAAPSTPALEAAPSPTPHAAGGAAAAGPFGSILGGLNAEAGATASGEYSILQELERAIRERIEGFLRWVSSGR